MEEISKKKEAKKMIKDENDEKLEVNWNTYKRYFGNYFGGCALVILSNLAMTSFTFFNIA